jgi:hypothetical protein
MIKRVFQDIDECILHTFCGLNIDDGLKYVEFDLEDDHTIYRTVFRHCAKELFEYYNSVVGKDNVYILTSATRNYAQTLNKLGEFGLDNDHIISREDIKQHTFVGGWGGDSCSIQHKLANKDNVLIDNLPYNYNTNKTDMMQIHPKNYHHTRDYYGAEYYEESFFEDIKKFIEERI